MKLTVTDNDGANASRTQDLAVTAAKVADTEPPVVSITSPTEGAEVSGRVTLAARASDNVAMQELAIYTDGKLRCSGIASVSCKWNLRKVSSVAHTITAVATDTSGNSAQTGISIIVVSKTTTTTKGKGRKK